MKPLRTRILASFAVAILVVATGWMGAVAISSGIRSRDRLAHTREVVDASNRLLQSLLDAENGQRGFLLTTRADYLAPYERVLARGDLTAPLRQLIARQPANAALLASLDAEVPAKLSELAETLRVARQDGFAAALEMVKRGDGERSMEAVRQAVEQLQINEAIAAEAYDRRTQSTFKLARMVVLGGSLLAFVLAVLVNLGLVSAFADRERAQQLVEEQARRLREFNQALVASNEELDQFAYATSHDLKAPLRGITNLASWVEEDLGAIAPPQVKEHLELLRSRARRLEALIEGILAYSRAGRVHLKRETVDTRALLAEVSELIAPPKNVQIEIVDPMPALRTERVPLQQVFMNLLTNAIKHGCIGGGKVRVTAREEAEAWSFSVQDFGAGIAPQFHDRVFGIFQKLASRDKVEGAGIGLAVVRKLVESRGGAIMVESQEGKGATFRFTWPKEERS